MVAEGIGGQASGPVEEKLAQASNIILLVLPGQHSNSHLCVTFHLMYTFLHLCNITTPPNSEGIILLLSTAVTVLATITLTATDRETWKTTAI